MKRKALSLLLALVLCLGLLPAALAAGSEVLPSPEETVLYLDGEKLIPTAEGTTHTFENGGVATLTTVGQNEAGGTDYALTLENVRAFRSVRQGMGDAIYAANLFFLCGGETMLLESKDTLAITLKGQNIIFIQGQADEAVATALVTRCPVSLSGDGSLSLMAAPAEGAETVCHGLNVSGDLSVGASLMCMAENGPAVTVRGDFSLTDGATLRWPLKLALSEPEGEQAAVWGRTLMNGETAARMVAVVTPSVAVTRGVAVFNLWQMAGAPAPEGEYPFADSAMDYSEIPLRDAIHWAGATGLAKGYGNGQFGENDTMTKEQFGVLLYRMAGSPAVEGDLPADFPYAATVSPWAKDAVLWAASLGVEPMDPQAPLTHGDMDGVLAAMGQKG